MIGEEGEIRILSRGQDLNDLSRNLGRASDHYYEQHSYQMGQPRARVRVLYMGRSLRSGVRVSGGGTIRSPIPKLKHLREGL